jgi:hypothetical protein
LIIAAPETQLTSSTPTPTVTGGATTLNAPETVLTVDNPAPAVNRQVAVTDPTELTVSTPNPGVQAGTATVTTPETQLTLTTVKPAVIPGVSKIATTPTTLNVTNADPTLVPGATDIQADTTELTLNTPDVKVLIPDIVLTGNTKALITTPNKFVDMKQKTFKEGDLGDTLTATLKDEKGVIDLTGVSSVDLVMQNRAGEKVLDAEVTIENTTGGEVKYEWESGDPIETAGIYHAEFRINQQIGEDTVPNDGYVTIEIEEEIN